MTAGSRYGADSGRRSGCSVVFGGSRRRSSDGADSASKTLIFSWFRNSDQGFTTISVALAVLLSLTLLFSAASAVWVLSAASELQQVADATALAGENAVAAFSTIAQVLDACVLSLGLSGVITYGVGLILLCVPGLTSLGSSVCDTASKLLDMRSSFSKSAAEGLETLESLLPALIVLNSAACVSANCTDSISYLGCAIPYPLQSESDYSGLETEVDQSSLDEDARDLAEATEAVEEASQKADAALYAGWQADCGRYPSYCLYQRAATLTSLSESSNHYYAYYGDWNFGAALTRARAYYRARYNAQQVSGSTDEELTDAACRKAFYKYALEQMNAASYTENSDGTVRIDFPSLPKNRNEMRTTSLYTQSVWPCTTDGEGTKTLHSSRSCSKAQTESASGTASLQELDSGYVSECDACKMNSLAMGSVASASTNIDNGFEYWWARILEAAEDYEAAKQEQAAAEQEAQSAAEASRQAFADALEAVSVMRPTLCPAGAWGTVAVVVRAGETSVPSILTSAFLDAADEESLGLSSGAAVSAAVLAPDENTSQSNVLASFFDSLGLSDSLLGSAVDGICGLWGSLLVGYGSLYESIARIGSDFLDTFDSLLGSTLGSWLQAALQSVIEALGFEPADMRLRKPVLCNTQNVFAKSGISQASTVRSFIEMLPDSDSASSFAAAVGVSLLTAINGSTTLTLAELSIPGTDISIPLTIDLSTLGGFS